MAATNPGHFVSSIDEAIKAVGQEFGVSDWMVVDQNRIDTFAEATGDHQWIHRDVERAQLKVISINDRPRDLDLVSDSGTQQGEFSRRQRENGYQLWA